MPEELLPCPFCGKVGAKLVPGGGYWKIKCKCGITISGYAQASRAVEVWNRRPVLHCEEEGCKEPAVMFYCDTHAP